MKRSSLLRIMEIGILFISIVVCLARGQAQEKEESKQGSEVQKTTVVPLPSSLDTLFPPKAERLLYLLKILGLGTLFSAILAGLLENDPQHAKTNFERFKAQYVEVSKLVPEWEKEYPMDPVIDSI